MLMPMLIDPGYPVPGNSPPASSYISHGPNVLRLDREPVDMARRRVCEGSTTSLSPNCDWRMMAVSSA